MRRRWVLLIVSVLLAATGTALVAAYVRQAETRAAAGQVRVPVLVTTTTVPAGTAAADLGDKVATREVPRELVAPGAVASPARLRGAATERILPGQQIVTEMFSTNAGKSGLPIPPNQLAVSYTVDDPGRVAGYVQPGSTVAVFVTGEDGKSQLVLPVAHVVAVGLAPDAGGASSGQPSRPLVTFALPPGDATRLADAAGNGRIWLGLLGQ